MNKISQGINDSYLKFCGAEKPKSLEENKYINRGESLEEVKDSSHILDSLDKMRPDKLLLVHLTDHLPKDGVIKSVKEATRDENGISQYRDTIHFALNHAVYAHKAGNWNDKKVAILAPFTKQYASKDDVVGGEIKDFFIKKQVELPEGTVIVRHNSTVPKGKLKVVDPKDIEEFKETKGLRVLETSESVHSVADSVVEMMGYTNLNQGLEIGDAWEEFCKENDLESCKHTTSVYGRSEALIECIKLVALGGNSWVHTPKSIEGEDDLFESFILEDGVDYKKEFLKVIKEIRSSIIDNNPLLTVVHDKLVEKVETSPPPKKLENESFEEHKLEVLKSMTKRLENFANYLNFIGLEGILSYNIQKLYVIIKDSKTPQDALDRIKEDLKLIPMVSMEECLEAQKEEKVTPANLYLTIDSVLGISEVNKPYFNGV